MAQFLSRVIKTGTMVQENHGTGELRLGRDRIIMRERNRKMM